MRKKQIDLIYHIADIHIMERLHKDIVYAFDRMLDHMQTTYTNTGKTSIVVIAGDVFHDKTKLSASDMECFNTLVKKLETRKIFTIVIPGNHDYNINGGATDLISPLVDAGNYQYVKVYKINGIYTHFGIDFHIICPMFGGLVPDINGNQNLNKNPKIAIIHEPVESAINWEPATPPRFTKDFLNQYDAALLGDIHTHQFITNKAAYPGSLVQVTKTESLSHGFIVWDLEKITNPKLYRQQQFGEFFVIPLLSAHLTFKMTNQIPDISHIDVLNAKSITVELSGTPPQMAREFEQQLKNKYKVTPKLLDLTPQMPDATIGTDEFYVLNGTQIEKSKMNLNTVDNQLAIIQTMLLTATQDERIREWAINYHKQNIKEGIENRSFWKLRYLYWDNALSYGKDNYINFDDVKGIMPILGKNTIGKSAILDILKMALYVVSSRGTMEDMVNRDSTSMRIIASIDMDDDNYVIDLQRIKGKPTPSYLLYKNNEQVIVKNAADYKSNVAHLVGPLIDFEGILTRTDDSMSLISMSSLNLLNTIEKYLGLDKFTAIASETNKKLLDLKRSIKTQEEMRKLEKDVDLMRKDIKEGIEKSNKMELDKIVLANKIKEIQHQIDDLQIDAAGSYSKTPLSELQARKTTLDNEPQPQIRTKLSEKEIEERIETHQQNINNLKSDIHQLRSQIQPCEDLNFRSLQGTIAARTQALKEIQEQMPTPTKKTQVTNFSEQQLKHSINQLKEKHPDITLINEHHLRSQIVDVPKGSTPLVNKELLEKAPALPEMKVQLNEYRRAINRTLKDAILELKQDIAAINKTYGCITYTQSCESCTTNKSALIKLTNSAHKTERLNQLEAELKISDEATQSAKQLKQEIEAIELAIQQNQHTQQLLENKKLTEKIKDWKHYEDCKNDLLILTRDKLKETEQTLKEEIKILKFGPIHVKNQALNLQIDEKLNEIEQIESRKEKAQTALQNMTAQKTLIQITKAIELRQKISKLKSSLQTQTEELQDMSQQILEIRTQVNHDQCRLPKLAEADAVLSNSKAENERLKIYKKIIDKKEAPFKILKTFLKRLEISANNLLKEITTFKLEIAPNGKDNGIEIRICEPGQKPGPARGGSGFQKFIIDFALRISIRKCVDKFPKFMIIDEGFGCVDRENLVNVQTAMTNLVNNKDSDLDFMLVISHIESMESISNQSIKIQQDLFQTQDQNGADTEILFSRCAYGTRPEIPDRVEPTTPSVPAQETQYEDHTFMSIVNGKRHCSICKQDYTLYANSETNKKKNSDHSTSEGHKKKSTASAKRLTHRPPQTPPPDDE
jgi:DNA repair exonuclease SbcCD ATPase subunit